MNKKLAGIRAVVGICAAMGWWGFLYPELTMTADTYEIVRVEEVADAEDHMIEWDSDEDIYKMILEAEEGQIRYRSRFLMQLESVFRKLK